MGSCLGEATFVSASATIPHVAVEGGSAETPTWVKDEEEVEGPREIDPVTAAGLDREEQAPAGKGRRASGGGGGRSGGPARGLCTSLVNRP